MAQSQNALSDKAKNYRRNERLLAKRGCVEVDDMQVEQGPGDPQRVIGAISCWRALWAAVMGRDWR